MKEPSFARVNSAQPFGIAGHIVQVEVDIVPNSLNAFNIIGVPDKAVEESRDRVGTALRNSGFPSPKHLNQKTVVSLMPAELRKEGSYHDVAIAIGCLLASKIIHCDVDTSLFLGELSLNGEIRPLRGVLLLVIEARKQGFKRVYIPLENQREVSIVDGIEIYPAGHLRDVVAALDIQGFERIMNESHTPITYCELCQLELTSIPEGNHVYPDMNTIRGQESAKRACEIAAAGGHSIALWGPPGTGKTMLARSFTGLLPNLSLDESIEVSGIHSVAGTLGDGLITHPPFRSPHHTSSYVALVGGGAVPKPGEITLAHRGVLFLDEFPEFDSKVLESLRQPLEDRIVTVSRARGTLQFPAQFQLIAAMNPCPCGYAGTRVRECRCTEVQKMRYRKKLSGPLVDRIDVWVPVEHISYDDLNKQVADGESSCDIRGRVECARARALARAHELTLHFPNSLLKAPDMPKIGLTEAAAAILKTSAEKLRLSPRAYHRVMRVARTIADLADCEVIEDRHILDALRYRPKPPLVDL